MKKKVLESMTYGYLRKFLDLVSLVSENAQKMVKHLGFKKVNKIASVCEFSQTTLIRCKTCLHCCIKHLKTQVLSTHMLYVQELFFVAVFFLTSNLRRSHFLR